MDYHGKRTHPVIKMLINVERGLIELGFGARRAGDIVECHSKLSGTPPIAIRHEWSAHERALELVSILQPPVAPTAEQLTLLPSRLSLDAEGCLQLSEIKEVTPDEVDASVLNDMIIDHMSKFEDMVKKLGLAKRPKSK